MKPIDNDFKRQFTAVSTRWRLYVADMHELRNPNPSAQRLNEAMKSRILSDQELVALYENCEDPLITEMNVASKLERRDLDYSLDNDYHLVLSLGDMVANRIDFGEGTDRSIVGKMAKKARELGVPQHVYISDNIEANRQELQEYAHRNNLWTALRFKALEDLISRSPCLYFAHMNGNADVMSSFVSERVLPEETSPMQIFENSAAVRRYFKQTPGFLFTFVSHFDDEEGWSHVGCVDVLVPHSLDFGAMGAVLQKLKKEYDAFISDPQSHAYEWHAHGVVQPNHPIDFECGYNNNGLLIHEALRPDLCAKAQSVEGMVVYEEAMQLWPIEYILHGHTHNPGFVKYLYNGKEVTQIPPNTLAKWGQINHGCTCCRQYDKNGMLKSPKQM